jgi:hypothetical protein
MPVVARTCAMLTMLRSYNRVHLNWHTHKRAVLSDTSSVSVVVAVCTYAVGQCIATTVALRAYPLVHTAADCVIL